MTNGLRARRVSAVELLDATIARAERVVDNPGLPSCVETWGVTATYDTWRNQRDKRHRCDDPEPATRAILELGAKFSKREFKAAQNRREEIRAACAALFERTGASALLTPTLGCEAFPHNRLFPECIGDKTIAVPWLDWASFLYDANLTGMPAYALPMGLGDERLPLSLQVIGPMGRDVQVLGVAERIEALVDWRQPDFGEPTLWASAWTRVAHRRASTCRWRSDQAIASVAFTTRHGSKRAMQPVCRICRCTASCAGDQGSGRCRRAGSRKNCPNTHQPHVAACSGETYKRSVMLVATGGLEPPTSAL